MSTTEVVEFVRQRFVGTAHRFVVRGNIMTIPNMITFTGIMGVLLYGTVLVTGQHLWLVPVLIALIALSDALDGWLADRLDQHSSLGQVLDPLRDRALTAVVLMNLFILAPNNTTMAMIVLTLSAEALIGTVSAYLLVRHGKRLLAHAVGKARAAIQWVIAFACLVAVYWVGVDEAKWLMMTVAVIMLTSVVAATYYCFRAVILLR